VLRKLISLTAALLASAGIATAAAPAVAHDSGAVAARHGGDRDERPISTTERRKAAAAARKAVGGGNVTRVKREDDGRVRWEVKVRRGSREWEVRLDRRFKVVKTVRTDRTGSGGGSSDDDVTADQGRGDRGGSGGGSSDDDGTADQGRGDN
jgi:hypothetical protein